MAEGGVPFGVKTLPDGRVFSRARAKVKYGFPNGSRPRELHKLENDRVQIWWYEIGANDSIIGFIRARFKCGGAHDDVALAKSVKYDGEKVRLCSECFSNVEGGQDAD